MYIIPQILNLENHVLSWYNPHNVKKERIFYQTIYEFRDIYDELIYIKKDYLAKNLTISMADFLVVVDVLRYNTIGDMLKIADKISKYYKTENKAILEDLYKTYK